MNELYHNKLYNNINFRGGFSMKEIILSHYTVNGIEALPWSKTWETMKEFAAKSSRRFAAMNVKIGLRKVIFDDVSEDALMAANSVTVRSADFGVREIPIESIVGLIVDFDGDEFVEISGGAKFPCRVYKSADGKAYSSVPKEFLMEAVMHVIFGDEDSFCTGDCNCCASGCGDEEQGIR